MNESEKRNDAKSFENNTLLYIQLGISVAEIILGLCNLFTGNELAWRTFLIVLIVGIFALIIMFTLAISDMLRHFTMYLKEKQKLDSEAEVSEEIQKRYAYRVRKLRVKCLGEIKKNILPRFIKSLIFVGSMALFFLWNPQNTKAFWSAVDNLANGNIDIEKELDESEDNSETLRDNAAVESTKEQEETKAQTPMPKPVKYRFVIDEVNRNPELDLEVIDEVFFCTGGEENSLEIQFLLQFDMFLTCQKEGIDLTTVENLEGKLFADYDEEEKEFRDAVENTKDLLYWEDWIQVAPHSDDLDKYIVGRENLNSISVDGKCGNYKLWWRLANDYQYYAQEYETQTNNSWAIWYYYSKSIYCCMEALQYDLTTEQYKEIFNYIEMRYQDMARNESLIPRKYKVRAAEIWEYFQKTDYVNRFFVE